MFELEETPQASREKFTVDIDDITDPQATHTAVGSQILQFVAANGGRSPIQTVDKAAMRAHIQTTVEQSLGQMLEFERFGHNRLFPKVVDLNALKARVWAMKWRPLQDWQRLALNNMETPVLAFLDKFKRYREVNGLQGNNLELVNLKLRLLQEGLDEHTADFELFRQANLLAEHIGGTLDLMPALMFYPEEPSWKAFEEKTRDKVWDEILPLNKNHWLVEDTFDKRVTRQLDHIVNSVTWDERNKREDLGGQLQYNAKKLLNGVTLRAHFAEKARKASDGTGLADYMHGVCKPLREVLKDITRTSQFLTLSHVDPAPITDSPKGVKAHFVSAVNKVRRLKNSKNQSNTIPAGFKPKLGFATLLQPTEDFMVGLKDSIVRATSKTLKTTYRVRQGALRVASKGNPASNQAILTAGLILLDTLQQTTANVSKAKKAVKPLRDAIALEHELQREALQQLSPALGDRLRGDASGWQTKAVEAETELVAQLETLMPLAQEDRQAAYLSDIRDQLKQAPLAARNTVATFDQEIKKQVGQVSAIQTDLCETTLRLGKLGMAGRADFDTAVKDWSEQLKALKDELKTSLVKATGYSANNFSRRGMLSRGWAEQAEANKRRYLAEVPEADRAEAESLYQRLFLEVMEDHLPLFAKETDLKGQRLLARLRTELGHAARGTTIYPATMAEILAGMKSTSEEIRVWSRKRLVRSLLLGISMGSFSLLSMGWRITARLVTTGYKIAATAGAASKGVRVGEGKANDELLEYVKSTAQTVLVKLVVSSIPGLPTALGVGEVIWDAYEGGIDGAIDKIMLDVAKELPQMPGYGARQLIQETGREWAFRLKDHLTQMFEEAASDTTLPGETLTPLNTRDQLSRMSKSEDPKLGPLATHLLEQLGEDDVQMSRSNLGGPSRYNLAGHRIILSAEANDWEILHEIAHSLTARKLRLGLSDSSSSVGEAAASIEALRQMALAKYEGSKKAPSFYYLSTAEEFVAGLYSGDSDFLAYLSSLTVEREDLLSLLTQFIGWLLDIPDDQQNALIKAMGLTDKIMVTKLTSAEARAAIDFEAGEELFSAPAEVLPGWKRIGQFNRNGQPVPLGRHVELTFGYKGGGTWRVVIEIPQDKRGWPAWQHYVANYLNTETPLLKGPWRRPVRVGEAKDEAFQAALPGSAHEVFVPSTSPAEWMMVVFAEQPSAESGIEFIRAPVEAPELIDSDKAPSSLPGFRQIGAIDQSSMSFPPDKQLHLHFVHRNGGKKTVVIDIPQDQRADGQWQRYAVDYINNTLKTVELGALYAEVSTINGVSLAKIHAGNSDITRVDWSFNAPTKVPGSDLEFPHRELYLREGTRILALLADQKALEAERSQALGQSPNADTRSFDRQLESIAARIRNAWLYIEDFNAAAQAENDLFSALMTQPEVVKPTDDPLADALANAKAHHENRARQLSAIQAYRALLKFNSRWYRGEEPGAREEKLNLLHARITAQMKLDEQTIQAFEQQLATRTENVKIRERNLARSESAKSNHARALELQTELNRVNEKLKNAWRYGRHQKVLDKDLANMPAHLTGADLPNTDASLELLATRDRIAAEIVAVQAMIKQAEDTMETESPVSGAPAPLETATEPVVPAEPSVSRKEFEGLTTNAQNKVDNWIVESAKQRGLDITVADLDKPISVKHIQGAQARTGVSVGGVRRVYTLRQILLGEADRSISIEMGGPSSIAFIDGDRGFLEETTDPIILFLRGEYGAFLSKKPNRTGVASDVMAKVDEAIDEYVQRPQVQAGFKTSARGNIATTLMDNAQQIDDAGDAYQQIFKGYMAQRLEATPVYVNGVVVPGVVAIGKGDYRIIISLDQRKFVMFNALAANETLAAFLSSHMAELDKSNISEADVSAKTNFKPRIGFTTQASPNITFGEAQEDVYATLLQASADKLKSNLGGAIYTREEAADDLARDFKKALAGALGIWLTIFSSGAASGLQFWLGVQAAMGSVATDIYIDTQNAINSDRLSDKLKAERDVRIGKLLGAASLVLPFLSKVKVTDTAKDAADTFAEITSSALMAGSLQGKAHVSTGPTLSKQDSQSPPQEISDSHALPSKPPV